MDGGGVVVNDKIKVTLEVEAVLSRRSSRLILTVPPIR